jgi:hypothetical protein
MITNKALKTHFMQWLKNHRRNLSEQERVVYGPEQQEIIYCALFLNAIEQGRNYPDRPDQKQKKRKLGPLAAILKELPSHTKAELAEKVAPKMQANFKRLCGTVFNNYLIKDIILEVYKQTANVADQEAERKAAARQWKKTDAPFVALGLLRFHYHFFTGCDATKDAAGFAGLADIALLAFDPVAKPALLIDKVLSADSGELFKICNLGN